MEFIIDKNCSNLENVEIVSSYMTPFLCELLNSLNVLSLDYFVVADSEEKSYANTVMKYASIVGTEASVTAFCGTQRPLVRWSSGRCAV